MTEQETVSEWERLGVDTSKPSVARVYDAILGGKDNFAVDRAVAAKRLELIPDGGQGARLSRGFLARGVAHMARAGITQFLDIGSGLPTAQNTHQVAQSVSPGARVVYVDHDAIVLAHARALLTETPDTRVMLADFRAPEAILDSATVREFLDWSRPVGLLLVGLVHHIADAEDPAALVRSYVDRLPVGSYLLLSHFSDASPEARELEQAFQQMMGSGRMRSPKEIEGFFDGLELVEPGVVPVVSWHPEQTAPEPSTPSTLLVYGGLGRRTAAGA
ncbi:SAM-dependent methyltransferase [Streptacidiphilus carbonis]|uniref:SAM-dependent methyltransferase n=1 Tax=Streptacidiphilus carbonis TaxID=105422 RepID=UPI0005A8ABAD|nr:SAM-dependent methyltransferase [Streptacidiphilus carbonis]